MSIKSHTYEKKKLLIWKAFREFTELGPGSKEWVNEELIFLSCVCID